MQKLYNLCQQQFWLLAMRLAKERCNDLYKDFRENFWRKSGKVSWARAPGKFRGVHAQKFKWPSLGGVSHNLMREPVQILALPHLIVRIMVFLPFFFNNAEVLKCRNDFLLISFYLCARVIHIWGWIVVLVQCFFSSFWRSLLYTRGSNFLPLSSYCSRYNWK